MDQLFQDLPPGFKLYHGVDQDGGLKIIRPNMRTSSGARKVSEAGCVALALTQICCDTGNGRFYSFMQNNCSETDGVRTEAFRAFSEVPNLLYEAYVWSDENKKEWNEMTPVDQLHRLSARYGWISKEAPVLPIALSFDQSSHDFARLMDHTTAPVTIHINPRPFVGYTDELRQVLGPVQFGMSATNKEPHNSQSINDMSKLDAYLQEDGAGIVKKIEEIFWSGREGVKASYEEVRRGLIRAGEKAAEAGQAYGITSGKSP